MTKPKPRSVAAPAAPKITAGASNQGFFVTPKGMDPILLLKENPNLSGEKGKNLTVWAVVCVEVLPARKR